MNQQVFGAYLIVKILSKNRNYLKKYECIPSTWVQAEDVNKNTVVFGYPKEDRLVTRSRIIKYEPVDTTWQRTFGDVVFDTDSHESAFQNLERKNAHQSITDQPKDSGKQDNKEVQSTKSNIVGVKPITQPKKKRGRPRKRQQSDQESVPQTTENEDQTKKKRGRPRKPKQSDQKSIQSEETEDELKKKLELEIFEAHELIRTYASDFEDDEAVFSSTPKSSHIVQKADTTQILPNESDIALEDTPLNRTCKITKRPRRKSTRQTRNLSEEHLGNETDNALKETSENNTANILIKRRKSTRRTRSLSEGHLGILDEDFDTSDQILPNETDNALEKTPVKNKANKVIKRRKSTRQTSNLSERFLGFSDEDFDRPDQILPNETEIALEETQINNSACKIINRRKSTRQTRNLSEGCLGIPDEDFDRSDQILSNETDFDLKETQVKKSACKIMKRRKSTRQTRNLSEGYLEFSDEDFDRSDDSDYTPEIVHPTLPDLSRPSSLSVSARDQDIINMDPLNDQFYSVCYNFYVEFNESYQKSMSILENAEDFLQNVIFTHKHKLAAKTKPPSPSPSYQQPDAISPDLFTHLQPLLQERSTSSISEEDATWTVRFPKPGLGLVELMPNTGVYVSEKGLNRCKSTISETTKFTRALLEEVFTDEALRKCSFTGVSRRKIRKHPKKTPKPGLDPKTRETFLDYVLKYSLNMGWEKADPEIIMRCIKNRLQWLHTSK